MKSLFCYVSNILCDNNIGNLGAIAIAENLPYSNLTHLVITGNSLSTVGSLSIIRAIPDSQLVSLEMGFVGIWGVGGEEIRALGNNIPGSKIKDLNIVGNYISGNVGDLEHAIKQLETLNLAYNEIGSGIANIAAGITNSTVKRLDLTGTITNIALLAHALPHSEVEMLILAGTPLTKESLESLGNALRQTLSLKSLELTQCGIADSEPLHVGLKQSNIQNLYLGANDIASEKVVDLLQHLPPKIKKLALYSNNIGEPGTTEVMRALENYSIEVLYYGQNFLGPEGAQKLAAILPRSQLKVVIIAHNDIKDLGAIALANVLIVNPIQKKGISWITRWLDPNFSETKTFPQPNTQLETLYLRGNNITNEGARYVCGKLKFSGISASQVYWEENPDVDEMVIKRCGYITSDASKPLLPWHFRVLQQAYRFVKNTIWSDQSRSTPPLFDEEGHSIQFDEEAKRQVRELFCHQPHHSNVLSHDQPQWHSLPSLWHTPHAEYDHPLALPAPPSQPESVTIVPELSTVLVGGTMLLWAGQKLHSWWSGKSASSHRKKTLRVT